MEIIELTNIDDYKQQLVALLIETVDNGASIGFLPPLSQAKAEIYWNCVAAACDSGARKLLIAVEDNKVLGAVQIYMSDKPNGSHRAEVEKLMVREAEQGRGIGKQLMEALEDKAKDHQKTILILDTREGDIASCLYRNMGYIEAGKIPNFALSATGKLDTTVFFYKEL